MRFFALSVLVLLLVATVPARVDQDRMKQARTECEEEITIDSAATEIMKEYAFCLFKKMGFQNEAGDFQEMTLRKNFAGVLPQTKIDQILSTCTIKKATPQESAFHAVSCIENINRTH